MSLTRIQTETVIVKRLGPLMEAAGMAVTIVGTNADLNDPLAWATRMLGHTTADVSTVTDAELAAVAVADYDDFLVLAEYRTLQNILGALDDVDIVVGPRAEKLSQLAAQAENKLKRLSPLVEGFAHSLETGYITLDIAEHE